MVHLNVPMIWYLEKKTYSAIIFLLHIFTTLPMTVQALSHYLFLTLQAGYQITQYDQPIAEYGQLKFNVFTPGIHKTPYEKVCKLRQVQLEQDSGKTIHDDFENRYLLILSLGLICIVDLMRILAFCTTAD